MVRILVLTSWTLLIVCGAAKADFSVDVAEAPTSNLSLTVGAVDGARQSIYLNIYELTSPEIADALISRIGAGLHVEILEEGQPVGGMSAAAKGIQARIVKAMQGHKGDHFYVMTSKGAAGKRRYHFDHAKYAVIDGNSLLIGSENYSPTGNPVPGTKGNRGWEVLIHDSAIAQDYMSVFVGDATTRDGDVIDATGGTDQAATRKPPKPTPTPVPPSDPSPDQTLSASSVSRVTSPDSSLSGLVAFIDQARSSLDIQQMTFDSSWSSGPNPLMLAIERAATRGVHIRVLLNDEAVFNHGSNPGKPKNQPTVDRLNALPNTEARIANLKGMGVDYIHNKGALADGQLTLISSINWDENAIQHNREAAVVITSPQVNAHYGSLFDRDWSVSAGSRAVSAEQPAPHPLVAADESVEKCPASLRLTVRIGQLKLDADDESFRSISGTTISGNFLRDQSSQGCVLENDEGVGELARENYVEIRSTRDGLSVIFEGFTPRGNKLYSVRAKAPKGSSVEEAHEANVFNGSAAHEYLGKARLELVISK